MSKWYTFITGKDEPMGWQKYFRMWWRYIDSLSTMVFIVSLALVIVFSFDKELGIKMGVEFLRIVSIASFIMFVGLTIIHFIDVAMSKKERNDITIKRNKTKVKIPLPDNISEEDFDNILKGISKLARVGDLKSKTKNVKQGQNK